MSFIIGFVAGAAVATVAFIIFHKNNSKKISKARAEILEAYKGSALEGAAEKAEAIFGKYFK